MRQYTFTNADIRCKFTKVAIRYKLKIVSDTIAHVTSMQELLTQIAGTITFPSMPKSVANMPAWQEASAEALQTIHD